MPSVRIIGILFMARTGTSASCPKAYRQPDDNFAIVGCGANNVSSNGSTLCDASAHIVPQVNLAITFCD